MPLETGCRQPFPLHREFHDPRPSITRAQLAYDQPESLEAIDGRGHRATGQAHLGLDF